MFSRSRWWLPVVFTVAGAGCFSSQHVLSHDELDRLAHEDPAHRGEGVRVTQRYAGQTEEPPAERGEPRSRASVSVSVGASGQRSRRPAQRSQRQEPARREHRETEPKVRDHREPDPKVRDHREPEPEQRDHASGTAKRGDSDEEGSTDAADSAKSARRLLIAAGAVGAALAMTRGLRYEGWVDVDPSQPIFLRGPQGEFDWVPLSDLTPEDVQWASSAFLQTQDGTVTRLGRAPLNRKKWTYSVMFGPGQIPVDEEPSALGFIGRFDIGYFPVKDIGIGADFGFGWVQDGAGETIYNSRIALQLQTFPFESGPIHGGLYGQVGGATRLDDAFGAADSSALFGGGGLFQLELTTTLALTARAGATYLHGSLVGDLGLGISIY